nr:MAG TPA: hypothetical protein [Caudoviricetes sp.]
MRKVESRQNINSLKWELFIYSFANFSKIRNY